jgi:hypothetical protein
MRLPRDFRSDLRELSQAALEAFAGGGGPTDDENRIVAANGPQHVRPRLSVERRGHGLSAARDRAHHDQLTDAVDSRQQLRKQGIERRARRTADGAVGNCVSYALRRRDARQSQLSQITRERGLRDVPTTPMQQHSELFLTPNRLAADQLENCRVTLPFIHQLLRSIDQTIARRGAERQNASPTLRPNNAGPPRS